MSFHRRGWQGGWRGGWRPGMATGTPGPAPTDSDADAFIARNSTAPTTEQAAIYDYFAVRAKAIGAWDYITDCGFLGAQDATTARLGFKDVINLTLVGTAPNHVPGYGTTGNGTSQAFDTGYMFPVGQQNDAHLGVYSGGSGQSNSGAIGNANSGIAPRTTGDLLSSRINSASAGTVASVDGVGLFIANRTGSATTDGKAWKRNATVISSEGASATPDATYSIWVGGRNGATPEYSGRILHFWTIGTGMPDHILALYALLIEDVCARLSASYTVAATVTTPTKALYRFMNRMIRQPSYVLGAYNNINPADTEPHLLTEIMTMTGETPGLISHEWEDPLSSDGVARSATQVALVQSHHAAGGINSVHRHPGNPVTGSFEQRYDGTTAGSQYDLTGSPALNCLSGGSKRTEFLAWVDRLITFFNACVDGSGNPIPLIFRPWHELNGTFFWWGGTASTIQLWKDTVDRIKAAGVQNVLFDWNNNFDPTPSLSSFFPGVEYVDFISVDYYGSGATPTGLSAAETALNGLASATIRRPIHIAELGYTDGAHTAAGIWTTKSGSYHRDRYSRSAFMKVWKSPQGPKIGTATEADFIAMVADPFCLTVSRLDDVYTSPVIAPDTTAPTITSASTASVAENLTLAHALTANETVTWSIVGGADAADCEISGATLRWTANGTQDFETPNDADTNNTYVVTVRATDAWGNTSDQTITVTVTDEAVESYAYESWTGRGWFDFGDTGTLTLSGSNITAMTNKRTGDGNLTYGGTAGRLTTVAAAQNGRAAGRLVRDVSSVTAVPRLKAASTAAVSQMFQGNDMPYTVIVAFKPTDTNGCNVWSASDRTDATNSERVAFVRRDGSASGVTRQLLATPSNEVSWGSGQASGTPRIVAVKHSGTAITVWDNTIGSKTVDATAQNTAALSTNLSFHLLASETNGASDPSYTLSSCNLDFYEIIVEDSAKSDGDVTQAMTDLASKWGITLS